MTTIDFYFNATDRLQVACRLAAKAIGDGKRMLVYAPDAELAARVDKLILVDAGGYPERSLSVPIGMRLLRMPGILWWMQNTLPRSLVEQGLRNTFGDPDRVTPGMSPGGTGTCANHLRQIRPTGSHEPGGICWFVRFSCPARRSWPPS